MTSLYITFSSSLKLFLISFPTSFHLLKPKTSHAKSYKDVCFPCFVYSPCCYWLTSLGYVQLSLDCKHNIDSQFSYSFWHGFEWLKVFCSLIFNLFPWLLFSPPFPFSFNCCIQLCNDFSFTKHPFHYPKANITTSKRRKMLCSLNRGRTQRCVKWVASLNSKCYCCVFLWQSQLQFSNMRKPRTEEISLLFW